MKNSILSDYLAELESEMMLDLHGGDVDAIREAVALLKVIDAIPDIINLADMFRQHDDITDLHEYKAIYMANGISWVERDIVIKITYKKDD